MNEKVVEEVVMARTVSWFVIEAGFLP